MKQTFTLNKVTDFSGNIQNNVSMFNKECYNGAMLKLGLLSESEPSPFVDVNGVF